MYDGGIWSENDEGEEELVHFCLLGVFDRFLFSAIRAGLYRFRFYFAWYSAEVRCRFLGVNFFIHLSF